MSEDHRLDYDYPEDEYQYDRRDQGDDQDDDQDGDYENYDDYPWKTEVTLTARLRWWRQRLVHRIRMIADKHYRDHIGDIPF